jgi:tight adherence protein B
VAEVVGDRVRSRREVRAITAQGRASGAILAVLPVAFVALLSGTGGEALGAFYRTSTGAGLLLAGLACDILGFLWIRRIVRRAETAP